MCLTVLFICHVVIQTDKTTRVCLYKFQIGNIYVKNASISLKFPKHIEHVHREILKKYLKNMPCCVWICFSSQ